MRPYQLEPLATLCFAFGMAVEKGAVGVDAGVLAGIADELAARGVLRDLMARMDPVMATNLQAVIVMDRAAGRYGNRRRSV